MASRKFAGVKINIAQTLSSTLNDRLGNRSVDNPVLKASLIWERVSDQAKDILGESIHRQWFENIVPIVILEKMLILECQTQFHARWLNNQYRDLIDLLIGFQDKNISSFIISSSERKRLKTHPEN